MNLGFKERFILKIESGEKRHTIREGKRWSVGMTAHLWKNMRGRKDGPNPQTLIFTAPVTKVDDITIDVGEETFSIEIDFAWLSDDEKEAMAKRGGFDNCEQMFRFWRKNHKIGRFIGQIIHWDYERRQEPA